jgi:hypothetical protein
MFWAKHRMEMLTIAGVQAVRAVNNTEDGGARYLLSKGNSYRADSVSRPNIFRIQVVSISRMDQLDGQLDGSSGHRWAVDNIKVDITQWL